MREHGVLLRLVAIGLDQLHSLNCIMSEHLNVHSIIPSHLDQYSWGKVTRTILSRLSANTSKPQRHPLSASPSNEEPSGSLSMLRLIPGGLRGQSNRNSKPSQPRRDRSNLGLSLHG